MTSVDLWLLAIALASFALLAAVLILLARSLLPMANALGVLNKVDSVIDDRIVKVVERIRSREERRPNPQREEQPRNRNGATEELRSIFGGTAPIEAVGDQPDADPRLEVLS